MLFEDILFILMGGTAIFFIGIPFYKLVRKIIPEKRNALQEAKERLEQVCGILRKMPTSFILT